MSADQQPAETEKHAQWNAGHDFPYPGLDTEVDTTELESVLDHSRWS